MAHPIYLIDANVLIGLKNYPSKQFPSLWRRLNEMVSEKRLFSCREVLRELESSDDECSSWSKANKSIFLNPELEEFELVTEILDRYPNSIRKVNIEKGLPAADPFLVASAKVHQYILLTNEKYKPNGQKIPNICERYEVDYIDWYGFLAAEDWVF